MYYLDITAGSPIKVSTTQHETLEDAITEVYKWVRPKALKASLPFHAWVQPWGVKQLTLDLRNTLDGWSIVNTDRVKDLVCIQISHESAERAATFSYRFDMLGD